MKVFTFVLISIALVMEGWIVAHTESLDIITPTGEIDTFVGLVGVTILLIIMWALTFKPAKVASRRGCHLNISKAIVPDSVVEARAKAIEDEIAAIKERDDAIRREFVEPPAGKEITYPGSENYVDAVIEMKDEDVYEAFGDAENEVEDEDEELTDVVLDIPARNETTVIEEPVIHLLEDEEVYEVAGSKIENPKPEFEAKIDAMVDKALDDLSEEEIIDDGFDQTHIGTAKLDAEEVEEKAKVEKEEKKGMVVIPDNILIS